jgi:hypothetical protein
LAHALSAPLLGVMTRLSAPSAAIAAQHIHLSLMIG